MRFLSVCSGIDAASVAWAPLGWKAAAFSEIDPFPCAVLHHRHGATRPLFMPQPETGDVKEDRRRKAAIRAVSKLPAGGGAPNFGDMTQFRSWPDVGPVDLLVGGTPCQSFSIAGLRAGLADPRGNLALTYLAIAERYRFRWLLWENVPGVLSSDGGRDFAAIIGGMVELGYCCAWRVLDAQYVRIDGFGRAVPQRRRRVFVVGYPGDWRRAAAVLFDAAGLHGDSAPRRETGQGLAGSLAASAGGSDGNDAEQGRLMPVVSMCLNAGGGQGRLDAASETLIPTPMHGGGIEGPHDAANIRAASGGSSRSYLADTYAVRRLMPVECERLQGFPDGFTDVPWRGKPGAPDGPRYEALGNSMAVNAMRWIGRRIAMVEALR